MKSYQITDPKYLGNTKDSFFKYATTTKKSDFILYRDKENRNYEKFAKMFRDIFNEVGFDKIVIHQNPSLAKSLNVFGVHLNSQQFSQIEFAKSLGLFTIISSHSKDEIQKAYKLGADAVTFSPIFTTPNKGKAKGVKILEKLVEAFPNFKIFALGGIKSNDEIAKLQHISNLYGFASIRFFVQ